VNSTVATVVELSDSRRLLASREEVVDSQFDALGGGRAVAGSKQRTTDQSSTGNNLNRPFGDRPCCGVHVCDLFGVDAAVGPAASPCGVAQRGNA